MVDMKLLLDTAKITRPVYVKFWQTDGAGMTVEELKQARDYACLSMNAGQRKPVLEKIDAALALKESP